MLRLFDILGEDVLVELRQHDDYISGKDSIILRPFVSLIVESLNTSASRSFSPREGTVYISLSAERNQP